MWLYLGCFLMAGAGLSAQETQGQGGFSDELTANPQQNAQWRQGQAKFSAKPRDMWELGIHAGNYFITGDVLTGLPLGLGVGVSLRKAINYTFSMRLDLLYGQTKGLDARLNSSAPVGIDYRSIADLYGNNLVPRSYKTTTYGASLQGILNMGNILFHKERNKWNAYFVGGVGLYAQQTGLDFLDAAGQPYDMSGVSRDVSSASARREARRDIKAVLDGDYETNVAVRNTSMRLNDETPVFINLTAGFGISRKLSRRLNLGLEYQFIYSNNDLLDGFRFRSAQDQTINVDITHYTHLRLGINLGKFNKRTEPLYWVNPLDAVYNDIADLKRRPVLDLTDSDGDGVIDMLDAEPNTPAGAIVDVKGKAIDSDGDGIPDYLDKEPFSPPGFEKDKDGVAIVPKYVTEEDVNRVVNAKVSNIKMEWYLPTINFDLDKYYIKPEYYNDLHQIAQVMKTHPNVKVVARGHADVRGKSDYNDVLSYNRANAAIDYLVNRYSIPRERFILQYSGDSENLVPDLPKAPSNSREKEMQQYINRRVEFRISGTDDKEMERPSGPDAGKGTPGPSRQGTQFKGNRNLGY